MTTLLAASTSSCGTTSPDGPPAIEVGSVVINTGGVLLERGYDTLLTATVKTKLGVTIAIPVAWRVQNEAVATIDLNGRLVSKDTGSTSVVASTLGVSSQPVQVLVVFQGPAKIASYQFTAPSAVTPGATPDSIRALVSNKNGNPVANARVAFAVTAGGGSISPAIVTTAPNGVASAEWRLGNTNGLNTVTATVLGKGDTPFTFVSPSVTSYTIRTFQALKVAAGDSQTAVILSALPINPSVLVVDSLARPRPGVPVTFTPTGGGRVATSIVSTGADGTASPGVWTLGDLPGDQTLIVQVDFATLTVRAKATGSPIRYLPFQVISGSLATCALAIDYSAFCFGEQPKVGDSTTVNRSVPTQTKTAAKFRSIAGSATLPGHFCGIANDQSMYCWGEYSLTDTASVNPVITTLVPTKLPTALAWSEAAPGLQHNCGLAIDQRIYCWGFNDQGQLGDATLKNRFAPATVSGGFKFSRVASGGFHSCGLALDGSVFCWGNNQAGQIGDGTTFGRSTPTAVSGVISFQSIAAGQSFTCGLTTTGRVYCWGNLGTGSLIVSTPRTYTAAPVFTSLTVGGFHACALTADGTAHCWGDNSVGQVGDSTFIERPNPTPVKTTMKFRSISAGFAHTCGSTQDGSVACWGQNKSGELGDTPGLPRTQPRFIVIGVKP